MGKHSRLQVPEKHMAHPQQQQHQQSGTSSPKVDDQDHLQFPENEGKREPLTQPDADALTQSHPRNVRDDGQRDLSQTPDLKPLSDGNSDLPPLDDGTEEPIGDRKDIR